MSTRLNTPAQTEQQTPPFDNYESAQIIPTLSDLVGFDVPNSQMHFPTPHEIIYTLDCSSEIISFLNKATSNASDLISDGIEAITDLLLTIELNNKELGFPLASKTRIDALALVFELSRINRAVNRTKSVLDRALPTNDQT